jgi:acetolactate synthase-1/3 small subunit
MQPSRESEPTIAVLELVVDNHAGTMSHICGLFARRAFSLEGILCLPVGDGSTSRMWLRVPEQDRLRQVMLQLEKLEDVLSVRRTATGDATFHELARRCLPAEERLAEGVAD